MPLSVLFMGLLLLFAQPAMATEGPAADDPAFDDEAWTFDDQPKEREFEHPDWFKLSFLDFPQDVEDAVDEGKAGIIVYFGQPNCAYCKALMEVTLGREDIAAYTQQHFDVVAVNVWGDNDVVDIHGNGTTEKALAEQQKAFLTPTLIFYDRDGDEALRLVGYHPPYKFRAALEYVADGYYLKQTFRDFLARADPPGKLEPESLNEEDFFESPPYMLDRSHFKGEKPLTVFFEQGNCHPCDVLHTEQLQNPVIRDLLDGFEVVQLDAWADTPVLTPDGRRRTARQWASELGVFYTPTLMFFDESGKEIFRIDSLVRFYRLRGLLEFLLRKGYITQPNFLRWCDEMWQPAPVVR